MPVYFAYGSNMSQERLASRQVRFAWRRPAALVGYHLSFNKLARGRPGVGWANIEPRSSGRVEGVGYAIDENGVARLDECEVCPSEYTRIEVQIRLEPAEEVAALTYVARKDRTRDGLKPTREYLQHWLAARDILSQSYLDWLSSHATVD
jgi:gamma-glutamylcyclotransferase